MEPSDRLAVAGLAARYAQAVDRRNMQVLASLLTPQMTLVLPAQMNGTDAPSEVKGRQAVAQSVIDSLSHLVATRHVVDQQVLETGPSDIVHGETYCTAHHIYSRATGYRDNRFAIRYQDTYARAEGHWLFARRELVVDFTEDVEVRRATTA